MNSMGKLVHFTLVLCSAILLWRGEILQNRANVLFLHTWMQSKPNFEHVEMLLLDAKEYEFAAQLNQSVNIERSLDLYQSAWDSEPSQVVGYKWGKTLLAAEDLDSVALLWQHDMNRLPVSSRLCTDLGLSRKVDDKQAIRENVILLEALALDTNDANRCLMLGYVYDNQLDKASELLATAAFGRLSDHEKVALLVQLSAAYNQNGTPVQSAKYLADAIEISPRDSQLRNLIAGPLIFMGQYDEANFHLAHALDISPRNYDSLRLSGKAYEQKGEFSNAQAYYLQALEMRPDLEESYTNTARIYTLEGNLDLAEDQYRRSLKIFPDSWQSKILLARTLVLQEQFAEAQELYAQLLTHPNDNVIASARLELQQIQE
ncbi:MAG: tetratricopeptide repeat protein [Anaerolineae bacterium]